MSVNTLAAPIAFSNRYYRISLLPCQGDQTVFFRLFSADIHEEKEYLFCFSIEKTLLIDLKEHVSITIPQNIRWL